MNSQILIVGVSGIWRHIAALCFALGLAACSNGVEGIYEDEMGLTSYEFKGDGKVLMSVGLVGMTQQFTYEVEKDRVVLGNGMVLTRAEDHLIGPMGIQLVKVSKVEAPDDGDVEGALKGTFEQLAAAQGMTDYEIHSIESKDCKAGSARRSFVCTVDVDVTAGRGRDKETAAVTLVSVDGNWAVTEMNGKPIKHR